MLHHTDTRPRFGVPVLWAPRLVPRQERQPDADGAADGDDRLGPARGILVAAALSTTFWGGGIVLVTWWLW